MMNMLVTFSLGLFAMAGVATVARGFEPFQVPPHGKPDLLVGSTGLEAPTALAFDCMNRPYMINNRNPASFGLIRTVRDGKWVTLSCREALVVAGARIPEQRNMHANGELVIDDADRLYATIAGYLVFSPDLGHTFRAYPCRGSLELRVGPNSLTAPPAICLRTEVTRVDRARKREPSMAWWAERSRLSVMLPTTRGDEVLLGAPITITENCLAAGSGGHSGGTSCAVTVGDRTHVVYAELPQDVRHGGNPIYIATISRRSRTLIASRFLVTAPPEKADVHTRPTIAVDSKGYLHVLSGSHGQAFLYLRSRVPNDITAGWTTPQELSGRQCYASLVCDGQDRLHSIFREWVPHATLGYSFADAAEGRWSQPLTLVNGANPKGQYEYGIFYHRLFIDRASVLYLTFTFFEFGTDKAGNYPEALVRSTDGGESWELASRETFVEALAKGAGGVRPAVASGPEPAARELTVRLKVPDSQWTVAIERVYEVGQELWVISRVSRPAGAMGLQVISTCEDSVVLAAPDVPVRHFIIGKHWKWQNREPYTFIGSLAEIDKRLAAGTLLYSRTHQD